MLTRRATAEDWPEIGALLLACGLPLDGARDHLGTFLLIEDAGRVQSVAGLEVHQEVGLLRSVATVSESRSRGLATTQISALLQDARASGLMSVALLTNTARPYFERLGFHVQLRADAPPALQRSMEFQSACPASATFMTLSLHKEPTMTRTIPSLTDQTTTATLTSALRSHTQLPLLSS